LIGVLGVQLSASFSVARSQILISLLKSFSSPRLTTRLPSGLVEGKNRSCPWPCKVCRQFPETESQTFSVPSLEEVTSRLPSRLMTKPNTRAVCPFNTIVSLPVVVSHTFTTLPTAPAKCWQSGKKRTAYV